LAGLTDVDIAGLTNGQILQYNSTLGKWENVDRTDINLSELGDVTIVAPTNGQVLVYNSSTSKWENSSGGYVPYTGAVTTVNLGAQTIQAGSFVKAGGTSAQFLKADGSVDSTAYGTGSVTSVGLTMPSAFSVANSPVTTAGTLAVTGAGTVAQYIRGDGSLADFPATTGGGASVSYYLNGSVSQGTIGGVAYLELNKMPVFGAGTDITRNSNGYIASFITDAGDPNKLLIPAGNWNLETYFSANSGGGSPTFYVELYKYNGTTFTLIATSSGTPELIAFGTNINPYFTTLAVPETVLTLTDRLALRYYVNTSGRTITLHTEDNHLCQVITTFTTGLTALNGLTTQVQFFAVGTSGTDFAISSATDTHTFNLPTASATNRGALSSADWSTFNAKMPAITFNSPLFIASGGEVGITQASGSTNGFLSSTDWTTFNNKQNALTNPVTGTGTTNYLAKFTGSTTVGNSALFENNGNVGLGTATPNSISGYNILTINNSTFGGLIDFANNNTLQGRIGADQGGVYLQAKTNIPMSFSTNDTERMRITSGGAVLINRTTNINDIVYKFIVKNSTDVNIGFGIVGGESTIEAFNDAINAATPLRIYASKLSMGLNGNVLIGTTTDAGFKLDVNGTGRFSNTIQSSISASGSTAVSLDLRNSVNALSSNSSMYFSVGSGSLSSTNITGIIRGIVTQASALKSDLVFFTNSGDSIIESMRITSGGNVGIGTTEINARLQVASSSDLIFNLTRNTVGTWGFNVTSGGNFFLNNRFGTNVFQIADGGNVLIGTTTDAGYKLDVAGTLRSTGRALLGNSMFVGEVSGSYSIIETTGSNGIWLRPAGVSSPSGMFLTSGGNVGIGTTSPTGNLHIFGTDPAFRIQNSGTGNMQFGQWDGTNNRIQSSGRDFLLTQTDSFNMLFHTNNTEKMRITSGGNVGIGTTSPSFQLHINKAGNTGLFVSNTTGNSGGYLYAGGLSGLELQSVDSSNSTAQKLMLQPYGGNVLIGTTTDPGYKLFVNGFTKSSGFAFNAFSGGTEWQIGSDAVTGSGLYIYNTGGGYSMRLATSGAATFLNLGTGLVYSNGGTLTSTNPSDFNLKENIAPINYGLNEILKLNPVTFDWKKDTINQGKQYGFIAQEVQKIMPDLVKQGEYLGLDKEAIFTTLVKAIQELKQEIDTLKK
jgi:hypothetical protein